MHFLKTASELERHSTYVRSDGAFTLMKFSDCFMLAKPGWIVYDRSGCVVDCFRYLYQAKQKFYDTPDPYPPLPSDL